MVETLHVPAGDTEMITPLVEATPVDPPIVRMTESARVKVVAPMELSPGYVLHILYQEKDERNNMVNNVWKKGVVKVPAGGSNGDHIRKGDVFEAETIPFESVKQIRGRWSTSAFDIQSCCGITHLDTDFCLLSWFCPPVASACLYEQISALERENFGSKKKFKPRFVAKSIGFFSALYLVLFLISLVSDMAAEKSAKGNEIMISSVADYSGIFGVIFLVLGIIARSRIRKYYGINSENYCHDCICVACFMPCAALQAYHHMRKSHEHPHLGYIPKDPLPVEAEKLV